MNLEKFYVEKLSKEELHPLSGGGGEGGTNCGTAWTRSEGADSDADTDSYGMDKDAEISLEVWWDEKRIKARIG